jgi:hypothetical protein
VHKHVDVPRCGEHVSQGVIEMFKKNNGINTYDYVDYRGKYITTATRSGL